MPESPTISLALQGGGAHGAFTWGVLDALLDDGRFRFEGVSGTSAGAMNALCLAHGLMTGGPDGARETLRTFWTGIADLAPVPTPSSSPGTISPALKMMLQWTNYLSPEQINPFDLNPLRDLIEARFDFAQLRRESPIKLFIATTHANSGKLRVFGNHELTADVFLASACLPTIHRTIVIDGEPYWDGGYSANPAVFPLFYDCRTPDILLVLLTPLRYAETPESAEDIRTRLRELAFNSTFLREMRMFAHLHEHIATPNLPAWLLDKLPIARFERRLAGLRFHAISAEHVLGEMPSDSKLAVSHEFFDNLFAVGHAHARRWLEKHGPQVGKQASLDLASLFY
ncbi:patatin-like phospholipase family protein [Dechloromonas agitata]|uniref:patatin-like phospholipase family protein n=1 Tax=Dechloromonas agitata TaxID=73030 RepID=UPI00237D8E2D|nr:patatin-like phospholipase family protein [Dechloromonas agitata]MDE1547108.1 patatin-like phospholipase family protein [Dechloromonas agitata]